MSYEPLGSYDYNHGTLLSNDDSSHWKPFPDPQVPQTEPTAMGFPDQSLTDDTNGSQGPSRTNLIINYIPQGMTDEAFQMLFQTVGPLKNSKICRNKPSGRSYGFGFVDYFSAEHAQKAIDTLNGRQIENKRLKVAFSRPGAELNKGTNLYLRNLPKLITENQIRNHFEVYGGIVNCRVLQDKATGLCNGTGFVLYDKKAEAQAAIDAMAGKVMDGATEGLIIRYADDNSTKLRPPNRALVNAFFDNTCTGNPHYHMSGPGPMRPPINRFHSRFNPMSGNHGIPIAPPQNKASEIGGFTLYVYNIGYHPNEQNIAALFSQYGVVNKVDIIWDWQKNQSKGFAFVSMATQEAAQMAIDNLNGYMLSNRALQVSFYSGKSK